MRRVLPLLIVSCLGFAPAPVFRERAVPQATKAMQGRWSIRAWGTDAMDAPAPVQRGGWAVRKQLEGVVLRPSSAEVVGDVMTFSVNGKGGRRWALRAAPDRGVDGMGKLDIHPNGEAIQGIYKLEGGTLTICYREAGRGRPADFTDVGQWKIVLECVSP